MRNTVLLTALAFITLAPTPTQAQWQLQNPQTTADLRGIDYVGNGTAWASGTNGTVLRTEDMGQHWHLCTTPPNGDHLDFRAIQVFDNNTAIVMSSGRGDLSRLYKTTDGCQTWQLLFTNPDKDGFWDAIRFADKYTGWLLGDPVEGSFIVDRVSNSPEKVEIENLPRSRNWHQIRSTQSLVSGGRGAFAASNSSLALPSGFWRPADPEKKQPTSNCDAADMWFGTSGPGGAKIFRDQLTFPQCRDFALKEWVEVDVPLAGSNASSGVFSIGDEDGVRLVAVGGDYLKPNVRQGTAAYTDDRGRHWYPASTQPGGYRSSVAWLRDADVWITVGPNGTDLSTDDGRNWRPLKPNPAAGDPPDADQHWNALSLPFAVGPHGRIGRLRESAVEGSRADKKPE